MPKLSKEELLRYQDDINRYYKYRRIYLAFGLVLLFAPLTIMLPIAITLGTNNKEIIDVLATVTGICIGIGIVLLILRSALFNQRIKNRKRLIQQAKDEYNIERMYSEKKEEEKIGL